MNRKTILLLTAALTGFAASAARIGIVSDTHIGWKETDRRLEQCYRLFKAQKVDRIVNLGDICEWHNPAWYRQYVAIREKVYPEGLPPETYVFATHDKMKVKIPKGDKEFASAFERMKPLLKVTNDRYDRFECEGFTFLVYPQAKDYERMEREIDAECAAHPGRPLFVLDHVPPANTVYDSSHGGDHRTRKIFDRHPEVIALSGHIHGSQMHEGKIWQDGFTAIGLGTIKQQACPGAGGRFHMTVLDLTKDRAVFHRYDIASGEELDPEHPWTLMFPYDPKNAPYSLANRRAAVPVPAFAADASIEVRSVGNPIREVTVRFPAAKTKGVSHYEVLVEAKTADGWKVRSRERVMADYVMPPRKRKAFFEARFASGFFEPNETVRFAVQPVDFFCTVGARLEKEFAVGATEEWKTLYDGVPTPAKPGLYRKFSGTTVFGVPPSAMDVPDGTCCRIVLDVAFDMADTSAASFNLRTDKTMKYAFGYIYTPNGKSDLRYVREFSRPSERSEDYNLYLQRAPGGRVLFRRVRIECRK